MTSKLIEQLSRYGVRVIQQAGKNWVVLPWPPDQAPAEVIPLLRELKQAAMEPWDEYIALGVFDVALKRLSRQYPKTGIPWASAHRPELLRGIHNAARRYSEAFLNQNLADCRQAVAEYERAVMSLYIAFKEKRA